jgi:tetratricopeptide (TPR) repeat protein
MQPHRVLLGVALALLLAKASPAADDGADLPAVSAAPPEHLGPAAPPLRESWGRAVALEQEEELLESTRLWEALADSFPHSAHVRWRIARNHWRYAERLPVYDKDRRMHHFRLAERWADAALEADPECGECVLWKLAALGRQATTGGVVRAAGTAPEIARLIERGIALEPSHADSSSNVTLANLYYAGSAFYRVVPDWFWLEWLIGVRGDRQRALEYIRKALEITATRVDYQVELGAVLLCIGHEERDEARLAEGRAALRGAMALEHFQSTDRIDLDHAAVLLDDPSRACTYSRDGWIDLREARRKR